MSILLGLLLAQARILPEIDRRALDLQASAEALQTRGPTRVAAIRPLRALIRPIGHARIRAAAQVQRLPTPRRASGGTLDLSAITTICRAAGNQSDPVHFLSTLSRAYALSTTESGSLRTSCAAYLAGRADARVNNYGAPAH